MPEYERIDKLGQAVPPEHGYLIKYACYFCGARATVEGPSIVLIPGEFSRCISEKCRLNAQSSDLTVRRGAVWTCPIFASQLTNPVLAQLTPSQSDRISRLFTRLGLPPLLIRVLAYLLSQINNPVSYFNLIYGVYFFGAAIAAAGVFIGQKIIVVVPAGVHLLKHFTENSAANAVVFCVVLVAIAEAWVRASRWYPRMFGLSEMSIGVGMAFSGFRDTSDPYAALFALAGGAFTIIDGRQRLSNKG